MADASQLIFTRESRFAEKLAEKDATLWDKLKKLILDAIDKLKKVLQGIPRDGVSEHIVGHLDELREYFDDMMADALYRAGHGTAEENDFFESALEKGQEKEKSQATGKVQFKFRGYAEDGKGIYESNFPKGTPKAAKSEKILDFIQNVWSKQPIPLVISNGESSRSILAQFDPTIDRSQNVPTDASKLAGGNRHGNHTEQRVTLDLADDYYQIASESTYNYSKEETGKDSATHSGVKMWHYFVNDIYFMDQGSTALIPYTVTINVKEKQSGDFVYSFNAEQTKESSTRRTLHADVNTRKGANGELFIENITEGNMGQAIIKNAAQSLSDVPTNSIPQKQDLSTENSEVSENSDMQSQERRVDPDTDRQMLARALEGAAKSEADRGIVKDYAERLGKYRDMQKQLNDIRKEIDEKLEAVNSGAVHKSELNPLYNRANLLEEKLRSEDAKLLRMEALAPLHNLVEAERAKAREAEQAATREKVKSEKRLEAQKQAMENRQAANKRKAEQRKLRIQYLARAERAISRLYRWTAHPTKKDHVPTELLPYVKSLFEAVDVSHQFARIEKLEEQLAAQRQRIRELQDSGAAASVIDAQEAYERDLVERIRKLEGSQHNVSWADRLESLKKIMSSVEGNQDASQVYVDFAPGLAEDIERQLDTFTDKGHVRLFDAKPEDIRFYAEAIESIAHSITEAGRLYANKRAASVEVLAEFTIDEFKHSKREAARSQMLEVPRKLYGLDSLNPAYFAHKLGRGTEAVMDELYDGFYQVIENVRTIDAFSERLKKEYHTENYTGKQQKIHRIMLEQGGSVSLTTGQLMTVAALSDRPQAQKHMFGRGIQSYTGDIKQAIGKVQDGKGQLRDEVKRILGKENGLSEFAAMLFGSSDVHRVTQKDIDRMIGELTAEQQRCVKEIKRFLREDIAAMGNKTSQKLYLYDMFTEETYFPIETVATFRAFSEKQKDIGDKNFNERSIFSVMNKGFTKQLQEEAGNPIVIRDIFDVYMEHCFDMANYAGLGVAVSDTIKWLSYRQKVVDKSGSARYNKNTALSSDEEGAVVSYKSGDSYKLNALLRENPNVDELPEGYRQMAEQLDSALEKLPTYEGTVYRNIGFDDNGGKEAFDAFLEDHMMGRFITYSAYTSTSIEPSGYPVEGEFVVHMEIHGVSGRNLDGVGNNMESEVLFPRDQLFFIQKVEYDEKGIPTIYMQEVNENGTGQLRSDQRGTTMRDMQEPHLDDINLQSVSQWYPEGNNARSVGSQGALSGGQRDSVRTRGSEHREERTVREEQDRLSTADGTTLRDEMEKAWGKGAERYIRNLLMSIEGELKGSDGARVINKLVRNAKIASVELPLPA